MRSGVADAEADSLLAQNGRALEWLERYFGVPYPFGKYDFVLAPAFPFGGMEHPGAVFYSEERFVFRERPTRNQRIGRAATIYHEVAHQWLALGARSDHGDVVPEGPAEGGFAVVRRDEVHDAERQALHLCNGGDVVGLAQRAVGFDQHVDR